jgi:hypothetical protein
MPSGTSAASRTTFTDISVSQSVKLEEALSTSDKWSGLTFNGVAGEVLNAGYVCYLASDGKFYHADADAAATMPAVAMATAVINANTSGVFLLAGFYRSGYWIWTVGGVLYASTTAGELTQTAPSGSGDQVQKVGIALTEDIIIFNPDIAMAEVP